MASYFGNKYHYIALWLLGPGHQASSHMLRNMESLIKMCIGKHQTDPSIAPAPPGKQKTSKEPPIFFGFDPC